MPKPRSLLALLAALFLGACDAGLSGRYEEVQGLGSLDFQEDGTVYVSVLGATFAGEYEVEGERVVIQGPQGSQVFTWNDGRLEGGHGLAYVRK
jgi:hypothetical protein